MACKAEDIYYLILYRKKIVDLGRSEPFISQLLLKLGVGWARL